MFNNIYFFDFVSGHRVRVLWKVIIQENTSIRFLIALELNRAEFVWLGSSAAHYHDLMSNNNNFTVYGVLRLRALWI